MLIGRPVHSFDTDDKKNFTRVRTVLDTRDAGRGSGERGDGPGSGTTRDSPGQRNGGSTIDSRWRGQQVRAAVHPAGAYGDDADAADH